MITFQLSSKKVQYIISLGSTSGALLYLCYVNILPGLTNKITFMWVTLTLKYRVANSHTSINI